MQYHRVNKASLEKTRKQVLQNVKHNHSKQTVAMVTSGDAMSLLNGISGRSQSLQKWYMDKFCRYNSFESATIHSCKMRNCRKMKMQILQCAVQKYFALSSLWLCFLTRKDEENVYLIYHHDDFQNFYKSGLLQVWVLQPLELKCFLKMSLQKAYTIWNVKRMNG